MGIRHVLIVLRVLSIITFAATALVGTILLTALIQGKADIMFFPYSCVFIMGVVAGVITARMSIEFPLWLLGETGTVSYRKGIYTGKVNGVVYTANTEQELYHAMYD